MKTAAIIQARMGSTRLPGKILMELCGQTVLWQVVHRMKQCKTLDGVIVATSTLESDDIVVRSCQEYGVPYFRGSESDVLGRFYHSAKFYELDTVVRITADCPLIDPQVVDEIVTAFQKGNYGFATNGGQDQSLRTYPRGLDTEVFSMQTLERAFLEAKEGYEREHVTPFLYTQIPNIYHHLHTPDYSSYRWTLDTPEDYQLIKSIYEGLYSNKPQFGFRDVLSFLEENPDLVQINQHVEQKTYGR